MDRKTHYKLYKGGKNWLCMAIATLSVAMGGCFTSSSAQADTNNQPQATSTVVATSALTSSVTNEASSAEAQSAIVEAAENTSDNKQQVEEVKTDTTTALTTAKQAATTTTTPENGWNSDRTAYYQNGKLANGYVQADDGNYYMFKNGTRQKGVQKWMGTYYYFDPTTYLRVDNDYREQVWQDGTHDWYMFGSNGQIVTGKYDWQGNVYYFDPSSYLKVVNDYRATEADGRGVLLSNNGAALSGVQKWMGTYYYFDPVTKLRVDNKYVQSRWGLWYMFGSNGQVVSGKYDWQGSTYYFDPSSYLKVSNDYRATERDGRGVLLGADGRALSGVQKWMGTYYYFDPVTKLRVDNNYVQSQWGDWYMFGNDGRIVQGFYNWKGSLYYFDNYTFLKVTNDWRDGVYFGSDGRVIDPSNTFSGRVINWFRNHERKLTYSMYGSRNGEDGTADCSGAMTEALYEAGATKPNEIYDTGSISPYLLLNGYSLVYEGQSYYNPRFGDIVIWGPKNHTTGGNGHMVIVSNMSSNPNCISVNWLSRGKKGAAVSENNYYWYWNTHGKQYQQVFRPNNIEKS